MKAYIRKPSNIDTHYKLDTDIKRLGSGREVDIPLTMIIEYDSMIKEYKRMQSYLEEMYEKFEKPS